MSLAEAGAPVAALNEAIVYAGVGLGWSWDSSEDSSWAPMWALAEAGAGVMTIIRL